MAHELEIIDGKASFFAVREPGWHQLGQVVSDALTTKDALRLSGLDYTVHKTQEPVYFRTAGEFGNQSAFLNGAFATYRSWGDGRIDGLGVVGKDYQVVQTTEAADLVEAITDQHHSAIWETGGSLREGRQFFMSIKLGEEFTFPGSGDRIETWMVVASSHDGSMALTVYITRIRVVCANTLAWSLGRATNVYRVKHTSGATAKVSEARESLELAWDGQDAFSQAIDKLMHTTVTDDQFYKVTQALFPVDDDMTTIMKNGRLTRRAHVADLYFASPTVGEWTGTAYGLWNAVSEYEQWLAPSRGKTGSINRAKAVAARNVFDVPSDLSRKALALL